MEGGAMRDYHVLVEGRDPGGLPAVEKVGDELRDLVKGYLAKLETDGVDGVLQAAGSQVGAGEEGSWQKALRWCPQELVDLINSKACRGE